MLVFPQWRPDIASDGCRIQHWMPAERLAPYVARTAVLPPSPPTIEDEDSMGSSSPDGSPDGEVSVCGWLGCGARFGGVARLSAHVARAHAHAYRDGLFYCGWKGCARPQRGFNARYKMLVHVRTHTNERPHICTQCNKSFSRAENLKIHLRSHSGEKPYVCPYEGCGKAYSNSSDRFKHTRTHTVDKPYYCKVPGCNKRYTDPSSLRKHVKTYKHFMPKEPHRNESPDEVQSPDFSPLRDNVSYSNMEPTSPLRVTPYSPPQSALSPTIPPYNPILPLTDTSTRLAYGNILDTITYIRPLEPIYTLRVPPHEMSYLEYTQMYEHAYRNYYSNAIPYTVLRPNVDEKVFIYDEQTRVHDVTMENVRPRTPEEYNQKVEARYNPIQEDMPLNLKCVKRLECKPIEELVRRTDLPLDLSTKT